MKETAGPGNSLPFESGAKDAIYTADSFSAAVLNALPAHIALVSPDGVILNVNHAWQRFSAANAFQGANFGVGLNYLEICDRAEGECSAEARATAEGIRKVLSGILPEFSLEYPCHSPEEQRWFRLMVSPLTHGPRSAAVVMHVNITERKLAEERLRRSEAKFRTLVENSFDAVAILALDGVVTYASNASTRLLGYALHEFVGHNSFQFIHPEDLECTQSAFAAVLQKPGEKVTATYRARHRDGSWIWVETVAQNCIDHPEIRGIVCNFRDFTAARLTLEELRVSEERSQAIIDSALDAIITTDGESRITEFNPAAEAIFGYERAQVMGRDVSEVIIPQSLREAHWRGLSRFRATGEAKVAGKRLELPAIRADGTEFPVELTVAQLGGTEPTGFVGFLRDITERRKAEEAIQMQARILDSIAQAVVTTDMEGRILYVNRFAGELYGWAPEEMKGEMARNLLVPSANAELLKPMHAQLRQGHRWSGELLLQRRDGSRLPVWTTSSLLIDARGEPRGIIGTSIDITEQKRAAEQLAEQATLLDEVSDAIVLTDLNHRIQFWSKGAERVFGWTALEAEGRRTDELLQPDPETYVVAVQTVIKKGKWDGEIAKTSRSGARLTLDCRWRLLRDADGCPKSILALNSDITERKKLEQQFLRAQRMESIGTLAGGIAHDLNNVLAPILMCVDVLRYDQTDPETLTLLNTIGESALRGANMVQQVLSFARGVEGERAVVNVGKLVTQVAKIAEDTFPKNIAIRAEISPDLQRVSADATQLHQVLLNLCVNARDAMPEGGKLTLSAKNVVIDAQYASMNIEAAEGPYLLLQVEDTGTGMSQKVLDQIFDPFFTTKEVGKGTGLGLSTSLGIVKSHGGFIRVYSEPGKGTRFRIYLPAVANTETSAEQEEKPVLPHGHGELILVVDDEEPIRRIISHTLKTHGYEVLLASDGAEALALYVSRRAEIRLVITDMMMPLLDGASMVRALRKINPDLPIIASSGLSSMKQSVDALGQGVQHFLHKPYTAEALLKAISGVLKAPDK